MGYYFKYKINYGHKASYDDDSVQLDKQIILETGTDVSGPQIVQMAETLEADEFIVYLYNTKFQSWVALDDIDVVWKPINIRGMLDWSNSLKDYFIKRD